MKAFSHIQAAARSDVGRKRKNNEDAFGMFPEAGMFCVADGMGGGDDGEIASAAVVNAVGEFAAAHIPVHGMAFPIETAVADLRRAVSGASRWIFERAKNKKLKGCGATFVGVCLDATTPSRAVALHAGDSRLYRIRGGGIRQITKDHSAAELIGAKSEDVVNPLFRGVILRAVGVAPDVELELTDLPIKAGDRLLVCSDGLSKMIDDRKIASLTVSAETPAAAVDSLIGAANAAGGLDNVTAVAIFIGKLPPPLPTMSPQDLREAEGSTFPTDGIEDADTNDSVDMDFSSIADEDDEGQTIETMTFSPVAQGEIASPRVEISAHGGKPSPGPQKGVALRRIVVITSSVALVTLFVSACSYLIVRRNAKIKARDAERQDEAVRSAVETRRLEVERGGRATGVKDAAREVEAVAAAKTAVATEYDASVLSRLAEACSPTNIDVFVKTVRRYETGGSVESLSLRLLPIRDSLLSVERRRAVAVSLTEDVQDIVRHLRRYADGRIAKLNEGLSDHLTQPALKEGMKGEIGRLEEFVSVAAPFADGDPALSSTQEKCADILLGVPGWFR